jgi:subtilisin
MRHLLSRLLALLTSTSLVLATVPVRAEDDASAPAPIPGQYIVVLRDGSTLPKSFNVPAGVQLPPEAEKALADVAAKLAKKHNGELLSTFNRAMKGFSLKMSDAEADALRSDPNVEFVSADYPVSIDAIKFPIFQPPASSQSLPTGVDRVDAELNANKGSGIGIAVVDTGIDLTHPDLSGNVVNGKNCINSIKNANDDNGHGTHVAGTIAALNNTVGVVGVAPQSKVIAVKVLDSRGSGSWSSIICGLDWITANAAKHNIKIINMSLGGGGVSDNNCGKSNNDALHRAVCAARDAGITIVVAAGNSGVNASGSVPASYDDAVITVSALTDTDGKPGGLGAQTSYGKDDTFASFSNYGSVVDIAAPGVNIKSTWKGSSYNTISGTSMATPHVAGAAALYIKARPGSSWTQVRDGLKSVAEALGSGHTDPTGKFPEKVLKANAL